MDPAFKTRRLGRYTLLRPLGTGGMAELFLARVEGIEGFQKLVALKRILPHRSANHRFIRMFLDEARLVAHLDHPNIASVYDIGQEGGEYYFTMEYVHGPDLRRVLAQAPNRRLQLENVLHVAIGVCAGLHRAHEARDEHGRLLEIVHRDVSPSNVLVSYQGAVKIVDFGVAKAATIVSETDDGVVKGKYGYMSPEQCLGEPLTRQSDVFNIGILLWEMTVGRRLYKVNGDLVTLQRIVYVDAPPPSRYVRDYPRGLERIVMRALARDRAQRYQTAEQLQLELEAFALEHRIPVSAVSMGLEMRTLFRERVEAWQQAQQAGRSLADHLVEISSEHAPEKSSDPELDIDDVIANLVENAASPATVVALPRSPVASRGVPDPEPAPVPRRRSGRGRLVLGALALALGAVAATFVLLPPETTTPPAIAVTELPAPPPSPPPPTPTNAATDESDVQPSPPPPEITPDAPAHAHPDAPRPARPRPRPAVATRPTVRNAAAKPDAAPAPAPDRDSRRGSADPVPTPDAPPPPPPAPERLPDGQRPGTLDAGAVRATVRAHLGEITACSDRARMDNRDLAGRVVLRIDVAPTGRVTRVAIASSTGAPAALQACITHAVSTWSFPAPAGGVAGAFSYPFAF